MEPALSLDASADDAPLARTSDTTASLGPDPAAGAGIALLGIFVMGVGGASDGHTLFAVGVLVAVVGAVAFTLSVLLSWWKQR